MRLLSELLLIFLMKELRALLSLKVILMLFSLMGVMLVVLK